MIEGVLTVGFLLASFALIALIWAIGGSLDDIESRLREIEKISKGDGK